MGGPLRRGRILVEPKAAGHLGRRLLVGLEAYELRVGRAEGQRALLILQEHVVVDVDVEPLPPLVDCVGADHHLESLRLDLTALCYWLLQGAADLHVARRDHQLLAVLAQRAQFEVSVTRAH